MPRPAPTRRTLVLAFASVYLAWGSTYLAIRIAVATLPPTVLAGLRFTVAGGGMLLALRLAGRRVRVSSRELRALTVVAALLLLGGNGLVVFAEQSVPSGLAALIVATVPLWMAALAALPPACEPLGRVVAAGLVLGFLGVAALVGPSVGGGDLIGMLALVLAAFSWSVGSIYARRAGIHADPLVATGWEMLLGGLLFVALALARGSFHGLAPSAAGVAALVYLVTVGSWIGFSAYVYLLAHVPAAQAATYAYVNPVIAVFLGWWILGESITPSMVGASAVIVVAVALVTTARTHHPREPAGEVVAPAAVVDEP